MIFVNDKSSAIGAKDPRCLNCGDENCCFVHIADGVVSVLLCRKCAKEIYRQVVNHLVRKLHNE